MRSLVTSPQKDWYGGNSFCTAYFKMYKMKKIVLILLLSAGVCLMASAQKKEVKENSKKVTVETPHSESKVKKTTTPKQKVHNLIHPKNKKYSGVRVKHEAKKD